MESIRVQFCSGYLGGLLSRSLILEYFSEENTCGRVDYNKVVDGIRHKRFVELTSVIHQGQVFDLSNTVTSVYLRDLSHVVVLQLQTLVK